MLLRARVQQPLVALKALFLFVLLEDVLSRLAPLLPSLAILFQRREHQL